MRFVVSPEVADQFPGLRVVVVRIRGVQNSEPNPRVDALLGEAWRAAGSLGLPSP